MNNRNTGYDIGDVVKIPLVVEDEDGTAADPDTLTLKIKAPSLDTVTYTYDGIETDIIQQIPGTYYCLYTTTVAGRHLYRWTGTGDNAGVVQGSFTVRQNEF